MESILQKPPLNLVKKIHRFTHATPGEMKQLLDDADTSTPHLEDAYDNVHEACAISACNGHPGDQRKFSVTHINSTFYETVEADI